ncbi:putative MFS-type transporter C409,08 [Talaromyces islandicus]|uniref:Putative MFS-type transporter C409,08 n=1 Tax=Talaromyces islandicus TaxID=28573 RepID=A0A0U1LWC0_TALIS|nr:putative MFS-type transporter C409,08 [Talaromyces islandicus]
MASLHLSEEALHNKPDQLGFQTGHSNFATPSSGAQSLLPSDNDGEAKSKKCSLDGVRQLDPEVSRDQGTRTTVTWDGPADPSNPRNWPGRQKWINVFLISLQGTLSPIASTILALGSLQIASDFSLTDPYTPALPVGLYVLGLGIGPVLVAPCSELYGRRIAYITCFTIFTILNVGCALAPNITALSILRLLSGMGGSAGPSLGGSSIADMFHPKERGRAQAVYSLGPTTGPVIGGLIGGFIVYYTGNWRWMMWVMAIASGTTAFAAICFQRETYGPILLQWKKKRLESEKPNISYQTGHENHGKGLLRRAFTRPMRLLFTSPICAFMSLYLALIYGILYLHLITITLLFGSTPIYGLFSYRWTDGTTGLAYLGAGLGSMIGIAICAKFLNRSYNYMARRYEEKHDHPGHMPEFRLPFMQVGLTIVPAGLIMFGWSAEKQTHWIVPLLGACIFGLGMLMSYVCIHTYLTDAFEQYAASALAAAVVTRCLLSCVFTIVGFQLYRRLGYAW